MFNTLIGVVSRQAQLLGQLLESWLASLVADRAGLQDYDHPPTRHGPELEGFNCIGRPLDAMPLTTLDLLFLEALEHAIADGHPPAAGIEHLDGFAGLNRKAGRLALTLRIDLQRAWRRRAWETPVAAAHRPLILDYLVVDLVRTQRLTQGIVSVCAGTRDVRMKLLERGLEARDRFVFVLRRRSPCAQLGFGVEWCCGIASRHPGRGRLGLGLDLLHRVAAGTALLDHVCKLMRQETSAAWSFRGVFARREIDVAADGDRGCVLTRRQRRRAGIGMDVHVAEIGAEGELHRLLRRPVEAPAGRGCRLERGVATSPRSGGTNRRAEARARCERTQGVGFGFDLGWSIRPIVPR